MIMAHYHACVWIDHREARIFSFNARASDEEVLRDTRAPAHIHRRADHVHLGKAAPDAAFFASVAEHLSAFHELLIVGPGTARTELAAYLRDHEPELTRRVLGVEPVDHPTDHQILAAARKFFRSADRMLG